MSISDEDRALFQAAMKTVKPLHTTKEPIHTSSPVAITPKAADRHHPHYNLSNYHDYTVGPECSLAYSHPSIPKKRFNELKRGKIRREARLDLHGFRIDEAQAALVEFIISQYHQHHRCVLIIHGKGGNRFGEAPVLKNHVHHWLQQLSPILAYHSAKPSDGGSGALYVLLKSKY